MKWLIEKEDAPSFSETEKKWEEIHNNGYHVWSMSADKTVQQKIIDELRPLPHEKILIVGCGSVTDLQNVLCQTLEGIVQIVCIDFKNVAALAEKKENHPKIRYEAADAGALSYCGQFDIVINVNSILSESDMENRKILASCYDSLQTGGHLIGFFPTITCYMEITALEKRYNRLKRMFAKKSEGAHDDPFETHDAHDLLDIMKEYGQLYYTPLYLRMLPKEPGFDIGRMELFFCDSDLFKKQAKMKFGVLDPDILVYEYFVNAKKKAQ